MFFSKKATTPDYPIQRSDAEWRASLPPEVYKVLREHGTERPHSSPLNAEKRDGVFACAGCGTEVFAADTKFESGTGWPSFTSTIEGNVGETADNSLFMRRVEVHCAACGGHLGHVFPDGPAPTGQRYCINGVSLTFRAKEGSAG